MLSIVVFGSKKGIGSETDLAGLKVANFEVAALVLIQIYDVEWVWVVAHDFLRGLMLIPTTVASTLCWILLAIPFDIAFLLLFRRHPADFRAHLLTGLGSKLGRATAIAALSI